MLASIAYAANPTITETTISSANDLLVVTFSENVFNTNKSSVFKIEQNQRWNGFSQYFKENYSKYYLGS